MKLLPLLVVEDDENDVLLLKHAFNEVQITNPVSFVQSGEEAIAYLQDASPDSQSRRDGLPCLALMDVVTPVRSGVEVLQWIRAQPQLRHIIVILWTSTVPPAVISQAYAQGANSILLKPSLPSELTCLARLIKEYWLERNQFPPECAYAEFR